MKAQWSAKTLWPASHHKPQLSLSIFLPEIKVQITKWLKDISCNDQLSNHIFLLDLILVKTAFMEPEDITVCGNEQSVYDVLLVASDAVVD